MKQNLIIFGNGPAAEIIKSYFDVDSNYNVVAFTVDREYIKSPTFEGLPLLEFETIEQHYPIEENHIFIAIGYSQMNTVREKKYYAAKEKGYTLASYISSRSIILTKIPIGEHAFILEGTVIQPFAKIGNNVCIWVTNAIGHHSVIEDHNYIAGFVLVGGHSIIKRNCFLGNRSTINPGITVAEKTLLGACSIITKDTTPESVYIAPRSIKMPTKSSKIKL